MKSSASIMLFVASCLGFGALCCASSKGNQTPPEPNPSAAGHSGSTAPDSMTSGGSATTSSPGSALPASGGSAVTGTTWSNPISSGGSLATTTPSNTASTSGGAVTTNTKAGSTASATGGAATTKASSTASASGGTATTSTKATTSGGGKYAVIIKAAGYLKTPGPDTLTSATSEPYNTHVFADALAQHLRELNVSTSVVTWVDCTDLSCVHVPDSTSTAAIIVFAGPMYDGNLPPELQTLVPQLGSTTPLPKVTSGLASCNQCTSFTAFTPLLKNAGLNTVPSVYLNGEMKGGVTDASMHAAMTSFAQALVKGS